MLDDDGRYVGCFCAAGQTVGSRDLDNPAPWGRMSQFKCREWWGTVSGFEEFHDLGSLSTATVFGKELLLVGSYQGYLRVYAPSEGGFSPDHVVLETDLGLPVLQVASVHLLPGEKEHQIAVLHPRKLNIFQLHASGQPGSGQQYSLKCVREHSLTRTSCNMVVGPMGRQEAGQETVAVQSMDGQLALFTAAGHAFTSFILDFLIPGPLCHLRWMDAIATVNSFGRLDVFKYRTLGVSSSDITSNVDIGHRGTGRRLKPDWSLDLGDAAVQLMYIAPEDDVGFLLVLGERSVFAVRENGVPVFMKRLELAPSCLWPYRIVPGPENTYCVQYLLALQNGTLMVLSGTELMWSAQLPHPPVTLRTADLSSVKGLVVSLDELGHLDCSFLGTVPPSFTAAQVTGARDLNYEELDAEMKQLQKTVKEHLKSSGKNLPSQPDLSVQVTFSPVTVSEDAEDGEVEGRASPVTRGIRSVEVNFQLTNLTLEPLRDVRVTLSTDPSLVVTPSALTFTELGTMPPFPTPVVVNCTGMFVPMTTHAVAMVTYTNRDDAPRLLEEELTLPLSLFGTWTQPSKSAAQKITIDTNKTAANLLSLFQDVAPGEDKDVPTNALGFRLLSGQDVTLLASKTSERYRLQSDHMEALVLFAEELLERLSKHFHGREPKFQPSFSSTLPLSEYFEYIDHHVKVRDEYHQCCELLSRHSQQFRAIQKRLLSRFKDKTPSSLAHMDTLLDGTYLQLVALGDHCESLKMELTLAGNRLSAMTRLIALLVSLTSKMSREEYKILQGVLCSQVDQQADMQGWEERTEAAITQMLRTALAKNPKEQNVSIHSLEKVEDTQRLKRHIALFCDRVAKGGKLIVQ